MQVGPFEKRNTRPWSWLSLTSLWQKNWQQYAILSFFRFKVVHGPASDFSFVTLDKPTHPLRKTWQRLPCYTKIIKNDDVTKWQEVLQWCSHLTSKMMEILSQMRKKFLFQLRNKTPLCNIFRIMPEGKPGESQGRKKGGWYNQQGIHFFEAQHSTKLNGNPKEYQNVYRITINNYH